MFFLKVGQSKYIMDMYQNEYLFFNLFSAFRNKDHDPSGRNDPRECNLTNKQVTYLEITPPGGQTIKLSEISIEFNAQFTEYPKTIPFNICSLFMLSFDENYKFEPLDQRVINLGDKILLIYDVRSFIKILTSSLEREHFKFTAKPAEYYNPKIFNGTLDPHMKDDCFEYQKEYRILIDTPGTESIKLKLPGLITFSSVIDSKDINSLEIIANKK